MQPAETFNVGVNPSHLAILNNGKRAYVANSNNYSIPGSDTVSVLNLKTQTTDTTIHDPSFVEPYRIAVDHCDQFVYVCNSGSPTSPDKQGTISIIDTNLNKVTGLISGFDGPGGIVISSPTLSFPISYAYVTNYGADGGLKSGNGRTVSVVDLRTRQIVNTIITDQAPAALALCPCGTYLYVVCYVDGKPGTGTLNKIDLQTNQVVNRVSGFSGPFWVSLTGDGCKAIVSNFGSNDFAPYGTTVTMVNLETMTLIQSIETGIQPAGLAVSDKFVFVSNYNTLYAKANFQNLTPGEGTVSVISLKQGKVVDRLGPTGPAIPVGQSPSTITLSPDGKKLYVCKYVQNTVLAIRIKEKSQ